VPFIANFCGDWPFSPDWAGAFSEAIVEVRLRAELVGAIERGGSG
jgi:hypothetical protein